MYVITQQYTIGRYNESPEGSLSTTGAALLASTLAWAANNKIPFQQAILSLTDSGCPQHGLVLFLLPNSRNWNMCLQAVYGDLVNGLPLYQALRKRLGYFLPEYYLQAVEKAEKDGLLPEILPHFAKRMNLASEIRYSYRTTLALPFLEFVLILIVLSGLTIFILPNFQKIFNELLGGMKVPFNSGFTGSALRIYSLFGKNLFYLLLSGWLFLILFRNFRSVMTMIMEEILMFIPYFRPQLKNMAMLELAASISSYLAAGEDIFNAMKFSRKACNHLWLRRKLGRCIRQMENGTDWLDAWRQMKLNQPLNEWIICNAASRQNIAAGFDTMTDWLYHTAIRNVRKNTFWLSLLCVFINATIVFTIAYAVFASLVMIIQKL